MLLQVFVAALVQRLLTIARTNQAFSGVAPPMLNLIARRALMCVTSQTQCFLFVVSTALHPPLIY